MAVAIQDLTRTALQRAAEQDITGKNSSGIPQPDRIKNKNPYELRRQEISAAGQAEKERQKRALQRNLAQQGLSGGVALKQQRLMDAEARKLEASQLGTVDIEELLAKEREKVAREEREYQSGEKGKEREYLTSERLGSQDFISKRDQKEAERTAAREELQRKYLTSERLDSQQFESLERDKDRAREKEYQIANLTLREKELAVQADQFNSKQEFERWAISSGYSEAEKDRAWQAEQKANDKAFAQTMAREERAGVVTLEKIKSDLEKGKLDYLNQLDNQSKIASIQADAAYNLGKSGTTIPQWQIDAMNSVQKASFQAGKSGMKVDEYELSKKSMIDYRNALITTLDPEDKEFVKKLNDIMVKTGFLTGSQLMPVAPQPSLSKVVGSTIKNMFLPTIPKPNVSNINKTVSKPQYVFQKDNKFEMGPPR